jgi:hypothetical protein
MPAEYPAQRRPTRPGAGCPLQMGLRGRAVVDAERNLSGQQMCLDRLGHPVPVGRCRYRSRVAHQSATLFTGRVPGSDHLEACQRFAACTPLPPEEPHRLRGVSLGELGVSGGQCGLARAHQGVRPVDRRRAVAAQEGYRLLPVAKGVDIQTHGKQGCAAPRGPNAWTGC